jgi:hypothetical protein
MLQVIFDMIAGLLEGAWSVHQKKFEKKFADSLGGTSRSRATLK